MRTCCPPPLSHPPFRTYACTKEERLTYLGTHATNDFVVDAMLHNVDVQTRVHFQGKYSAAIAQVQFMGRQYSRAKQLCFCERCFPYEHPRDAYILQHIAEGTLLGKSSISRHGHYNYKHALRQVHPAHVLAMLHNSEETFSAEISTTLCAVTGSGNNDKQFSADVALFVEGCSTDVGARSDELEERDNCDVNCGPVGDCAGVDDGAEDMDVDESEMSGIGDDDASGDTDAHQFSHQFASPTDRLLCEIRLPGNDGANVKGCAGTEQGYVETVVSAAEQQALELMLNIFAFYA